MRVLVVDDDPNIRGLVQDNFLSLDHEVRSAASGREALALLDKYTPDIVVTDRRMPEMNGEELIGRIKETKPHLLIFFVLMTGDDLSPAERSVARAAGVDEIITKPFSEEKLEKVIDEAAARISSAPSSS